MNQHEIDNFEWNGAQQLTNEEFRQFVGFELITQNEISPTAKPLMKKMIKKKYLMDADDLNSPCQCVPDKKGRKCKNEKCLNRNDCRECPENCGEECQNQAFRKEKWKTKLRLVHRPLRGFSLVTLESIPKDSFVMEFLGQVYTRKENPFRYTTVYACKFSGTVDNTRLEVEPTLKGGLGRFLTHSFSPNCDLFTFVAGGMLRNVLIAKKLIKSGTEITWHYGNEFRALGIERCLCLERKCPFFKKALETTQISVSSMIAAATTQEEASASCDAQNSTINQLYPFNEDWWMALESDEKEKSQKIKDNEP